MACLLKGSKNKMPIAKVPKVDKKKCIGCGSCVAQCPAEAIKLVKGKAVIDKKKCTKCGQCITVCPVEAIKE